MNIRRLEAHIELKEDVVGVLVGKGHWALFLQMDGVNQRYCALVAVGLQIHTLWRPRGAAAWTKQSEENSKGSNSYKECYRLYISKTLSAIYPCSCRESGIMGWTVPSILEMVRLSPVTGLHVLSVWTRVQEAGQTGEACRDGIPLVKTEAAAKRVRASQAGRALLGAHL